MVQRLVNNVPERKGNLYTGTMGYMFEKVDKYLVMQSLWMVGKSCLYMWARKPGRLLGMVWASSAICIRDRGLGYRRPWV